MIYFVRTDYRYQSYDDFWNIVQLSGYPIIPFSKLDPQSNNTYICTPINGEWKQGWDNPKARIIWWDLEWGGYTGAQEIPSGVCEVWASDKHYAQVSHARYVPMGSHRDLWKCYSVLTDMTNINFEYDVALMAYRDPHRRRHVISHLERVVKVAPDGWGEQRDSALWASRLMVNIHQHDYASAVAPVRMAIAAAYRLPVLCEDVTDSGIFKNNLVWSSYEHLVPNTVGLLQSDALREEYAGRLYELLCIDYSFARNVKDALS